MQNPAKEFVRKIMLSVIVDALNPMPVWRHLLVILMMWCSYLIFQLPGFSDGLPIQAASLFWPTVIASTISYVAASSKNFLAPAIAFVVSVILLLVGFTLEGMVLNLYVYAGIFIGFPFRRVA